MNEISEELEKEDLFERFFRYVRVDTQSSETSGTHPSTAKQKRLAGMLAGELRAFGSCEVTYDEEHGYVYAKMPGAGDLLDKKPIGFIAHMDTSPAVSDTDVNIRIVPAYSEDDPYLKPTDFPELWRHLGETLIATDTKTLLGADDKAGAAEIMSMLQYFTEHPETAHRPICVAFTPDEEIGEGTLFFDLELFGAPEGYTVDGGRYGIIEYENFNAAEATVEICGKSVHPGDAKGKMINASLLAMEFAGKLPADERPETTEGRQGFFMVTDMTGECEHAILHIIVRDHDRDQFETRKSLLQTIASQMNEKYGAGTVAVTLKDQYYNMIRVMKDHMDLIDNAYAVIRAQGGKPESFPIRGGTDGAVLSFSGLPCPNLCTGGYNYHSRYEFASVPEMRKCRDLLIGLAGM
ncbi:MAG: peptidase T [Lachnospiraceae bacterium]|jgi:tripeptide aminopeptidase